MRTDDKEELMLSNQITGLSMAYMDAGHSFHPLCSGMSSIIEQ